MFHIQEIIKRYRTHLDQPDGIVTAKPGGDDTLLVGLQTAGGNSAYWHRLFPDGQVEHGLPIPTAAGDIWKPTAADHDHDGLVILAQSG